MPINLTSIVASAFATIESSVEGVVKSVTYRVVNGNPVYDPETGQTTSSTTDYIVRKAILSEYTRKEKEFDFHQSRRIAVETGDQKCLIPYQELPIQPSGEDTIIIDGVSWRVVSHSLDPTGKALHTFQIRLL